MTSPAQLTRALADRLGSAAEARWMVEQVVGRPDADARDARELTTVPAADLAALDAMLERRLAGEPLQYVLGTWSFRTLELAVDSRALIPRPETEQVVEVALERARDIAPGTWPLVVADLGTGTGAIALSLAAELGAGRPDGALRILATDVDAGALSLCAENLRRVGAWHPEVRAGVELHAGEWFGALPAELRGGVHMIVSNPPYVSEEEWGSLEPEVRCEPYGALVAADGQDGTPGFAAVETVIVGAFSWLAPGGAVVVELAPHQAEQAVHVAERRGFRDVEVASDLAGRQRAVAARR